MELAEYSNSVSSMSSDAEDGDNLEVAEYCNNNLNREISVVSDRIKEDNKCFATNYENVDLVNSHNNHIGTKIIANNITLVVPNKDENNIHSSENTTAKIIEKTRLEQRKKLRIIICVCTLMLTMPIVVSILTVNNDTNKFNENAWLVTREMWGAIPPPKSCVALDPYAYMIMIDQTKYKYCKTYFECCEEMQHIQTTHMIDEDEGYVLPDINYNYVIGGDGRVYEGRGWNCTTQTRNKYNQLLSIGFVGDYFSNSTNNTVTEQQMKALFSILDLGVKASKLYGDYEFVPICCYNRKITSPGDNLYSTLEKTGRLMTSCNKDEPCDLIKKMISNT